MENESTVLKPKTDLGSRVAVVMEHGDDSDDDDEHEVPTNVSILRPQSGAGDQSAHSDSDDQQKLPSRGHTRTAFIKPNTSKEPHIPPARKTQHGRKTKKEKDIVQIDPSQIQRRLGVADITAKEEKKQKVTDEEDESGLDEIERILRKREKKFSIEIPPAPVSQANSGHRIKTLYLKEKDMFHLLHEIKGTKYGPPCRPELTLLTVGKGAGSSKVDSTFPGVEVVVDFSKQLFILSDRIEDHLIMLCKVDPDRTKIIQSAVCSCETDSWDYKDISISRCWKRFVAHHLMPMAADNIRMVVFDARQKRFRDAELQEWGYCLRFPI